MGEGFGKALLAGALLLAAFIAGVFWLYWGNTPELKGEILKVRTLETADGATVAIADFRITNVSDIDVEVRECRLAFRNEQGEVVDGRTIANEHVVRLFEQFPILGQKFNDTFIARTMVPSGDKHDAMLVARFEVPLAEFERRQTLIIKVEETEGAVSTIEEGSR